MTACQDDLVVMLRMQDLVVSMWRNRPLSCSQLLFLAPRLPVQCQAGSMITLLTASWCRAADGRPAVPGVHAR